MEGKLGVVLLGHIYAALPTLWISSTKNRNLGILKLPGEMWKIWGNLTKVQKNVYFCTGDWTD